MSWLKAGHGVVDLMKSHFKKLGFNFIEESTTEASELRFLTLLCGQIRAVVRIDGQIQTAELMRIEQFFSRVQFSAAKLWQLKQLILTPPRLSLEQYIHQLRPLLMRQLGWRQLALQALCMSCFVSERGKKQRVARFRYISERLGYSALEVQAVESLFAASARSRHQQCRSRSAAHELHWAYQQLNLAQGASVKEIKTAYRRLMSRYHPDKLMAQGVGTMEMRQSTQKAQRIQKAYRQLLR